MSTAPKLIEVLDHSIAVRLPHSLSDLQFAERVVQALNDVSLDQFSFAIRGNAFALAEADAAENALRDACCFRCGRGISFC